MADGLIEPWDKKDGEGVINNERSGRINACIRGAAGG